jgi:hypothetical protein
MQGASNYDQHVDLVHRSISMHFCWTDIFAAKSNFRVLNGDHFKTLAQLQPLTEAW